MTRFLLSLARHNIFAMSTFLYSIVKEKKNFVLVPYKPVDLWDPDSSKMALEMI